MTREEVAHIEALVDAAAHRKRRRPSVLAHLRRLIKRVERGRAVPLALPGLPLVWRHRHVDAVGNASGPSRRAAHPSSNLAWCPLAFPTASTTTSSTTRSRR
jgi:hypothetical protein